MPNFPQPLITSRTLPDRLGSLQGITCWCCDKTPWTFAAYRPGDMIRKMEEHLQQAHAEIYRVAMLTDSEWRVSVDEISLFCGTRARPLSEAIDLWGSWSDYDLGDFSDAADMADDEWADVMDELIRVLKRRNIQRWPQQ